ncbi:MAG: TonB-dependent receptor, partial [Pirellulaceae bacterium]|nr:TonB-dependent receptor [Pirellulaceae bacterium]
SLNMTVDLNRRFDWRLNREMRLQFLIQNLFNESINHVEFQRKVINALPAGPGRTFYGGFTMAF